MYKLRYRLCCCLPVTTSAFNINFLIYIHANSFSYDSTVKHECLFKFYKWGFSILVLANSRKQVLGSLNIIIT